MPIVGGVDEADVGCDAEPAPEAKTARPTRLRGTRAGVLVSVVGLLGWGPLVVASMLGYGVGIGVGLGVGMGVVNRVS
jgi:hypothetical protein